MIQHPGSKTERVYWSLSAQQVMASNPGFYVAVLLKALPAKLEDSADKSEPPPARQLKLLRPDDFLVLGQVYRLISFEDVLKNVVVAKKSMDMLLKETGGAEGEKRKKTKRKKEAIGSDPFSTPDSLDPVQEDREIQLQPESSPLVGNGGDQHFQGGTGRLKYGGQWRPALQTIAEAGH